MKKSIKKGFSFGLVSGIITTLGVIIGLGSSTASSAIVAAGIFVIAFSDALSDALGIHISEESENSHTIKEIWVATIFTFLSKVFFSVTFIVPILLLPLRQAIIASVVWGVALIGSFSYFLARKNRIKPIHVVSEHVFIAVLVIIIAHLIGNYFKI